MCFLVLGLMVPVVADMADDAGREIPLSSLRSEARSIEECVSRLHYSGEGSMAAVEIDLPPGQSIVLGGEGADAYRLRLCVDGEVVETVYLDRPAVRIIGAETVVSGSMDLRFRCTSDGAGYGVELMG